MHLNAVIIRVGYELDQVANPPTMPLVTSFAPIADASAARLILGSMPGKASLLAGQYYAHPRNAFWPIMGDLVGAGPGLPYATRVEVLRSAGIAVWDVLASCARESSLDSDIDPASIHPNDFVAFFIAHRHITQVFFNGATAEHCFVRFVKPSLGPLALNYRRLPSTSPAHATMSYDQKLRAWQALMRC